MIAINRCIYAGYSSRDFDLKTCLSFEGDSGDINAFLSREAVASESYRGYFKRVHNYKYNDVLTPTITFIKEDFSDFTVEEQRKVLKWLTLKDTASFLTVYHDDSSTISYEILGGFIEINTHKLGNGRVVGITAKFESVAPWAFSQLKTANKNLSDNTITINIETDDPQNAIYPRFTIYTQSSNISITNRHTDETGNVRAFDASIENNVSGEMIVLDGANRVVSSSRAGGRIFGDDFSWDWIPLYEGQNQVSFSGNCTAIIEYREVRKVGEF